MMEEENFKKETLKDIYNFITFKNQNNFDEYFSKVLTKTSK
jgi:hypothetical protein